MNAVRSHQVSRPVSARAVRPSVAKYVFFAAFGVMGLFVLWNNERFFFNPQAPEWAHYKPIRWHLIPHGVGGTITLVLGALQFSTRLRRRYLGIHRVSGRLYLAGMLVAAPVAIWMAFINSPWFLTAFTIVQAMTWMLFTIVAYLAIRRGAVGTHREWMMRSYAVVLIFIEGRVLMAVPALAERGLDAVVLVNWACFAVTLIVVECMLRWREIVPNRAAQQALHPTSATPR
jgi:hypothetical protein